MGLVILIEQFEFQEFLKDDIVVVIYLIFLCFVGIIGNGYVFIIYYVRYKFFNYRMFVVWFVVIDFVVCVVSVLFEIVDIRYGYIFNLDVVCKCF